mmetsp:Transcript_40537/g.100813  ORF Transcript_40537/g.100813 Transcript_40537/m.100813 type:complete len:84 (+) Transcript_40537:3-254(+)
MANSAADFVGTYCADDSFPVGLFEQPKVPAGRDAAKDAAFSKSLFAGVASSGHQGVAWHAQRADGLPGGDYLDLQGRQLREAA